MGGDGGLDAFKARLPLAEIIGRHVRLTRRGREHIGLCPFHREKSPSFSVVEDKGFYHCFGCGAHGTAIDFVMQIEGVTFADALMRLQEMTGIEAPRRRQDEKPRTDPSLAEANAAAMRWFERCLLEPAGREARTYLRERGVTDEARERFHLGLAPSERRGLADWLGQQGFGEEIAVAAGLAIAPEDGGATFDRFRDRLMFPIEDMRGQIVGFGGRALAGQKAKYLNSPETPLFHKGSLLYGLPLAARAARKAETILLVEGYMDVVAVAQAGMAEVVAPLGTAVTEEQLRLLWRHAEEPTVCLDGDRAGFAAALRLARRALPVMQAGQSLRFVLLPEGDDPDSLVRRRGRTALDGLVRTAVPLSRLIWQAEWNAKPVTTPEQFAGLRRRLFDHVQLAGDHTLRGLLRDQFEVLLRARSPQAFGDRRRGRDRDGRNRRLDPRSGGGRTEGWSRGWEGTGRLGASLPDPARMSESRLLAPFLRRPALLDVFDEALAELDLSDAGLESLRREILAWHADPGDLEPNDLRHHLLTHGFGRVVEEVLAAAGSPHPLATVQSVGGAGVAEGGATEGDAARDGVAEDDGTGEGEVRRLLDVWRRRRAREQVGASYGIAIEQRRFADLETRRLSHDELLNGASPEIDVEDGDPEREAD